MSAPRPSLTEDEKERRRREKLCAYCADPNRTIRDCPDIAAKEAKKRSDGTRPHKPQSQSSHTSHAVILASPAPDPNPRAVSGKYDAQDPRRHRS